ncbi:MAG: SPFH domain-containing protein [Candidatus Kariarchaeaceae archaeon]|jgi:flotillin
MVDLILAGAVVGGLVLIFFIYMIKNYTIVPPHEAHVISGGKFKIFDGQGRYVYWPLWQTRNILSKAVLEISVPSIRLHDKDHLPFAVEISCKVQVGDARKAAETLGVATPAHIRPIVDDTIQSAARSQAMQHELVTIMRERDTIEESIYHSTTDSLSRLGVRVALFDIKNIVDVEGSTVIADLERVRSSEINRFAREAEAIQVSQAEIVEAQKHSESEIKRQEAFRDSEEARLKQEKFIAEEKTLLTMMEMQVLEAETKRKAEIEKQKTDITAEAAAERYRREARGKADARLIEAEAEAAAIKHRAEAEAQVIRTRLEAEAEGTEKLAKALKSFNDAGISVKIAEIYAAAQKEISENIARGLQNNTKLFLPVSNGGLGTAITSLIPTIEAMQEAGVSLGDLLKTDSKTKKKASKKTST